MAFETPYFMKSKTTGVGRSNQSVEDRLQRTITEIEVKQRKSILKIEQQMLKVREEYKLLLTDVDFSTDLDEHGQQIDPEACRSKSTGDLPPIRRHDETGKQEPKSAEVRGKHKRRCFGKKTKAVTINEEEDESKALPAIKERHGWKKSGTDRILSPTSTDYNPDKIEQRYLDFIDHSEKFLKSVKIDEETKRLRKKQFDYNVISVVSRANRALALSLNDTTIKSLLLADRKDGKEKNLKNFVVEVPISDCVTPTKSSLRDIAGRRNKFYYPAFSPFSTFF